VASEDGRVRWIVDGMNVIGSRPDGWWKDRHRAMVALVDRLDRWASIQGAEGSEVTVVFERPPSRAIGSSVVRVAHAPRAAANSADDEIVRLVGADGRPKEIRVVTSDRALTDRVRTMGASVYPAETFRDLIDPRARERHAD
jgi:predicted RNA-binding protein with PIN domain